MNRWSRRHKDEETEANAFAAELLMPESIFAPQIIGALPGFDSVRQLAGSFRTTLTATAIQYVKYTSEPCALAASRDLKLLWAFPSKSFAADFLLRRDEPIPRFACAGELHAIGQVQQHAQNVPAGLWLQRYDPDTKDYIAEDSIRLESYDMTLSLIWIHEDI